MEDTTEQKEDVASLLAAVVSLTHPLVHDLPRRMLLRLVSGRRRRRDVLILWAYFHSAPEPLYFHLSLFFCFFSFFDSAVKPIPDLRADAVTQRAQACPDA